MRTYYFDIKDGVPVRDRSGLELVSDGAAIAHSKDLADRVRREKPKGHPGLRIVVLDESGREVHRERIYPDAT
ncbi:hypothetical protein TSA1_24655 [Bradyrhizobium nitroreducens]|uniref:DUF6894 domain-containing protein n=1 Tax=Bradyrhizobium nitroreducens TaxID=709803 RepID=A0A2M6UNW0_9BRAD|nr:MULTISPECIES: hypothetical protein [Bradyrhizobium]PIT06283.1 hypothetical protein TSA1_24655 [Bradyrhizobium nitroreducens]TQF28021.1 hypothetical protein UNPF46_28745 [Bradyrhizobium sp. UNPF46]